MAKPFLMPTVTTRRITGISLQEIAEKLKGGGPDYVRVGLPDTEMPTNRDANRPQRPRRNNTQRNP
jgi:hypothetical protein